MLLALLLQGWTVETVGDAQWHSDLAVDADGVPHVVMARLGSVVYARRGEEGWIEETVADKLGFSAPPVALALDAKGVPLIAYVHEGVVAGRREKRGWKLGAVAKDCPSALAIAADLKGKPIVRFDDGIGGVLPTGEVARLRDGRVWLGEKELTTHADAFIPPSVADGRVLIGHEIGVSKMLRLYGAETEDVVEAAFDGAALGDRDHAIYWTEGGALSLAERVDGKWKTSTIVEKGARQAHVAVDPAGAVHVVYYEGDEEGGALRYAVRAN